MLTSIQDERVQAVANLDGYFAGKAYTGGRNLAKELNVPWMVMGSTLTWPGIYFAGYHAWTTNIPDGGSVAYAIPYAGHFSFSDLCRSDSFPTGLEKWLLCFGADPDDMLLMLLEYTDAFFRLHLQGDDALPYVL